MHVFILLADADWVRLAAPLAVVVFFLLRQVLSAAKAAAPPQRGKPPGRPPQAAPGRPANPQSELNAEIEQFLKKANSHRTERPQQTAKAPPAPSKAAPKTTAKPAPKPAPRPAGTQRRAPAESTPSPQREFDSVTTSVERHLDNRGFSQRAEHLADDIVRADQQMEAHMQKSFGRRLGTLEDSTPQAAAPATDAPPEVVPDRQTTGLAIAGLLVNPQGIKQAIVINEILQRPEHRW